MAKLKKKTCLKATHEKRNHFPRKAKDQSIVNLELGLLIEDIEANSGSEDEKNKTDHFKQRRTKPAVNKHGRKLKALENDDIVVLDDDSKCRSNERNGNKIKANRLLVTESKRQKSPVSLPSTGGLSHFMKLGVRTDLLCDTTMADPLGPDSFDNFQWVEVKQELPDDIEVCKVTLTELPLNIDDDQSTCDVQGANDKGTNIDEITKQEFVPAVPCNKTEDVITQTVGDNSMETNIDDCMDEDDRSDVKSSVGESFIERSGTENIQDGSQKRRKPYPQQCDICDKKLYSKGNLRVHKLKMHKLKVQFSCELCSLKFDYQRLAIQHRNSVHRGEDGRFGCDSCDKRIVGYHMYLAHVRSHVDKCVEAEGSDKLCSDCDKSFQDDESLRIHRALVHTSDARGRSRSDKNFVCDTCGRRFVFGCLLRDHLNTHTGAKPYLCQECGKAFCQKSALKQHTKTHSEVRPFQCSECPQGFYGKGDYVKHRRKHTGERPYVCEVCGEAFSRNTHLVIHRRTHTGERPHTCDICNRGFTKRGDVVRHRRVHTGELPYLCQVCGKAFRQSSQCANHIKSQHPDSLAAVARNPNPLGHGAYAQLLS